MDAEKKGRAARLVLFFVAGTVLLSALSLVFFAAEFKLKKAEFEHTALVEAEFAANSQLTYMADVLGDVLRDLLFLADVYETWIEQSSGDSISVLASHYLAYCRRMEIYDQIRIISTAGMETLRINYHSGSPAIAPASDLQDKSKRYYFVESVGLGRNAVYISPLDLNVENGEVEIPFKPMLRLARPVFADGVKSGVLVINFLAEKLLNYTYAGDVDDFYSSTLVLNSDGEILKSEANPDLEFRFMFSDQRQGAFQQANPEEYKSIYSLDSGSIRTDSGLYVWQTMYPVTEIMGDTQRIVFHSDSTSDGAYFWKVISFVASGEIADSLSTQKSAYIRQYMTILGPIVILSALAAWLIDINRRYRHQVKQMALYDALTGLPNRRLLTILGEKQLELARRQEAAMGVLFLDLDGFKQLNDSHGHAFGDRVLKEIAQRIPQALRSYDLVFRIGGDEFVVILQNLKHQDDAFAVGTKIIASVNQTTKIDGRDVSIGISIGASFFPEHATEIEELIQLADAAMYRAKGNGKNQLVLASSL